MNTNTDTQAEATPRPQTAPQFEKERGQFRSLILANPNYFGNLKQSVFKPVLPIVANKTYEEIGSVGFQPQLHRLNAVVYINQSSGYGGNVCANGSPEYVRFYASYDNGKTWDDLGLTSFTAYNISLEEAKAKRLEYAVAIDFNPLRKFCFVRNLAKVRAILSWNVPPPPNDPDFVPVWGEVHDTTVQIEPRRFIIFKDLLTLDAKLPKELLEVVDLEQTIATAQPKTLGAAQLQEIYRGKEVEPHRFALPELSQLIEQPASAPTLMAANFGGVLPELKLSAEALAGILGKLAAPTDGNTQYEELEAIGLNPNQDTLEGVIRVKLPNGYSGGTCTNGSREYVTFWADFDNNGSFETCLGTTSVNVYDIAELPKGGLEYGVFLPVNLTPHRQPCWKGPRTVRIRAILSWQVAPPSNNPNYVPVWGNREETVIHIKPGPTLPPNTHVPNIETVGSMDVNDITFGTGLANGPAQLAGFTAQESPFGGVVILTGHIAYPPDISSGAAPLKYRVRVRKVGEVNWQALTHQFDVARRQLLNGVWSSLPDVTQIVDGDDYYTYREDFTTGIGNPQITVVGNLLARWNTGGLDGLYDIIIDAKDSLNNTWFGNLVRVKLDNTGPAINDFKITSGGGNCSDFTTGAVIEGTYNVSDLHFGTLNIGVEPGLGGAFTAPVPLPRSYPGVSTLGEAGIWRLDTTGMPRCGYVIRLGVHDRTIVNSGFIGWPNSAVVGLCLREG